jgi:hypothetical protein
VLSLTLKSVVRNARNEWDGALGATCAIASAVIALDDNVRRSGVTILLAESAVGIAVLGAVLTALSVFATFFDGHYRRVLEGVGSLTRAMRPYLIVAAVGGGATVVGVIGALAWPAPIGEFGQALVLGVATGLCVWAVAGTISLVSLTVFHAEQRAELMRAVEDATDAQAQRFGRRASGTTPSPHP